MNKLITARLLKPVTLTLLWLSLALPALAIESTTVTYYHNDLLGSPVAATDELGALKWQQSYAPYGSTLEQEDGDNTVGYTGHRIDKDIGLTYAGARFYDHELGRFTGIDPVGSLATVDNPMMFNRYAYGNNNPYKYVDPDGRAPSPLFKYSDPLGMQRCAGSCGGPLSAGNMRQGRSPDFVRTEVQRLTKEHYKLKAAQGGKNHAGKQNRNQRLKDLVKDGKVSSADKGWIKQEMNEVAAKKKSHLRNPPGKDLAHERGRETKKGYGYEHAHLQNRKDHRTQHKLDNWGKNNKERPVR